MYILGLLLTDSTFAKKDDVAGVQWLLRAAERGVVRAMRNLGDCYTSGRGIAADATQAVHWYRCASNMGDIPSMSALAVRLFDADGVARDDAAAVALCQRVVESAGPSEASAKTDAMYALAMAHETGRGGLKQDVAKARALLDQLPKDFLDAAVRRGEVEVTKIPIIITEQQK